MGGAYPFKYEGQPDNCGIFNAQQGGCANNHLDPFGLGLGGGDVDIAVNYPSRGVPNLALVSLTLAPGITGTHSTDQGNTFSTPNPVVALIPGDDRQWIDGINALNVYLNYHDAPTFNIEVQRSNDGGETYLNGFAEAIDPQTFPAAGGVPASNSANVAGQIKVDRSSCPSRGNLYQIFVAPDSANENLSGGALRSVYVGVSTDVRSACRSSLSPTSRSSLARRVRRIKVRRIFSQPLPWMTLGSSTRYGQTTVTSFSPPPPIKARLGRLPSS